MTGAIIAGILGLGLTVISAWLHIKERESSVWWGFVGFCLIVVSCERSEPPKPAAPVVKTLTAKS